jgi:hypothetical protein
VATYWFIEAVMEAAELHRPALMDAQDTKTLRPGCLEERTRPTHQASNGSAERDQVLAHDTNQVWRISSLNSWRANFPGCFHQVSPRPQEERFKRRSLHALLSFLPKSQSHTSTSRQAPRLSQEALPNPSLKPSPNSKAPGPRYSAVHHLHRGPGAFLSVPA